MAFAPPHCPARTSRAGAGPPHSAARRPPGRDQIKKSLSTSATSKRLAKIGVVKLGSSGLRLRNSRPSLERLVDAGIEQGGEGQG